MGPLQGVKIIEMAAIGPVPFCGMLLADMGADVIRIDRPDQPVTHPHNPVHRGRRSIALDLKQPGHYQQMLALVSKADVLLEGFRPGVMERLNLGPEQLLLHNPRLVYGRMTGWGQQGPLAQSAGHDLNYIAISGALNAISGKNAHPHPPLNLIGDFGGGALYLATGVLAALLESRQSGEGQVIDAAMTDGAASLMTLFYGMMNAGKWQNCPGQNLLDGGAPFYDCYRCADGKFISIASLEPSFYQELLQHCGLAQTEQTETDAQYEINHWPAQRALFEQLFLTRTRDQWCELLQATDACFAPVLDMEEAPGHPHNQTRQTFIRDGNGWQPAPAPRFSRTVSTVSRPPPDHDQHREEILRDWGAEQ